MKEERFEAEYNALTISEKRQLSLVGQVKQMPKTCHFPWLPVGYTLISSPIQNPMPTPLIANAVLPNLILDIATDPIIPDPPILANEAETNVRPQRRRRDSVESEESYRTAANRRQMRPLAAIDYSKIKNLLKLYAPKLKWQRYPDNRMTTQQPDYETQLYHYFNTQSNNEEEEMIYRFFIEIKHQLTLAYEAESNANFHHFSVGAKLCMLRERLSNDRLRFERALNDLQMDKRYLFTYTPQMAPVVSLINNELH